MVRYARNVGGSNLRKLTFHDRAFMLKALDRYLDQHKQEFYELSTETGDMGALDDAQKCEPILARTLSPAAGSRPGSRS